MTTPASSRAAVQVGEEQIELQEFPIPPIGPDDGLLRVERNGICGSDVDQFRGGHASRAPYPVIPGHEPVGTIEVVGARAAERWGVQPGDRVVVEGAVPCLTCRYCSRGQYTSCPDRMQIGWTPTTTAPSLWGGFSEYLYLHPNASLHKMRNDVPLDIAALFNALACGISWADEVPNTQPGDTVLVMSPGQRGLASVIAAKAAGASTVIVTGLSKDRHKLAMALELGADHVVDVEQESVSERVRELVPDGVDTVVDLAPNAPQTVVEAIDVVRDRGTIVLAAIKGDREIRSLMTDRIVMKALTVQGVTSKGSDSYRKAIALIESQRFPLEKMHSHTFPLADAALAIRTLSGEAPGAADAICISLAP